MIGPLLRSGLCACALLLLAGNLPLVAQVAEYDWYPSFRSWVQREVPRGQRGPEAIAARYKARLEAEGVAAAEIERRLALLRDRRQDLENDFWNRFFTVGAPRFNTSPNAFLAATVEGRAPGRALDVGMGEGRNALFLAKLGWDVTGFDPADKVVALASERARALNVPLTTQVAVDSAFNFGRDQWDLIVYSWVSPSGTARQAVDALRPGGIVVVEAGRDWFPPNGVLRMFEGLHVLQYETRVDRSDFFERSEMPIVRLVAEKPRP